jgi:hypothetical protein
MKAAVHRRIQAATLSALLSVSLSLITVGCPSPASAQISSGAPAPSSETNVQTEQNQKKKKSKVLFQRSVDENGQTVDTKPDATPPAPPPAQQSVPASKPIADPIQPSVKIPPAAISAQPSAEDAERSAPTFTDFDMDVRLRPAEGHLAVRALVTVRNDGKALLAHLPLQLSSSLNWESIRILGRPATFTVAVLNSDADHTGQLHEAAVTLPAPLAPGASLQLDVTYSGVIAQSAKRLDAIGTPGDVAAHSDWDRISPDFTGLRGFGNVVWYPVSAVPVILGDGARLFDEIGEHKLRLAGSHFRLALTVETPFDQAPTVALVNGRPATLSVTHPADATVAAIATARVEDATLGFEAPSLFVALRASHAAPNMTIWARPESDSNVAAWSAAATHVIPFLQGWLGQNPRSQLTILDLPDDADIPFETGAMLATPVRAATPDLLDGVMAHALTHAWVLSPRAWLSEGVAHFMGTIWIEKQQGRERALATLDSARSALAIAEPESPGQGDGQPLIACISPVYYRTKAAYVFWMLRDLVTDATLSAALRAYDPAADTSRDYFEHLIEQAGQRHSLGWFFSDWVYADKGLPDLSIESVYPGSASVPGSYLVAVNLANNGYATAEVPLQVITETTSVTQRVIVQARSKIVQRVLIQGHPTEVRLNDGTIPEAQATIHSKTLDSTLPKP